MSKDVKKNCTYLFPFLWDEILNVPMQRHRVPFADIFPENVTALSKTMNSEVQKTIDVCNFRCRQSS